MIRILFGTVLAFIALSSGGKAQTPQEIFEKFRPRVCLVQFYKNVSSQAQIGSYIKIKQYRIGVIVREDGLVMVNSDVYPLSLDIMSGEGVSFFSGEPTDFKVKIHQGKEYAARFLGKDAQAQVAFVKITEPLPDSLPVVKFQSSEAVKVGQHIYVLELLGEGYNFEPLFSSYAINAVIQTPRRKFLVKDGVNALSAGGLVVTAQGEALGVTLRPDMSFNFHEGPEFEDFQSSFLEIAPSEWFRELIQNPPVLETSIYAGRAWLGIGMQALTPGLKSYWEVPGEGGVVIDRVYRQSPAEKAGLQMQDVIVKFGAHAIDIQRDEDLDQFRELVTQQGPGDTRELTIYRGSKTLKKKVTLAPAPRAVDVAKKYQLSELGVEVRELTRDILYDYDLPLDSEGVYVFQVDRASPAGLGGMEIGSIVTHVNGKKVKNLAEFEKMLPAILAADPPKLMFQTRFRRETQFVFVDPK